MSDPEPEGARKPTASDDDASGVGTVAGAGAVMHTPTLTPAAFAHRGGRAR